MELLFLGLIAGTLTSYFILKRFSVSKNKSITEQQSIMLLEKIKKVSKLITVEGEFAEIYHHEKTQEKFLGLISSTKKAIVIINAKAHIGFDFRKVKVSTNTKTKTVSLTEFPKPEVLSIEPDIRFYDIQNGFMNKFSSEDLTKVNKEAKEHILLKIPESNLMQTANNEAINAIDLMQSLVETIGWNLDYSSLELPEKKLLEA